MSVTAKLGLNLPTLANTKSSTVLAIATDNQTIDDGWMPYGPIRITHDGGASQFIATLPAVCDIQTIVVQCKEASATRTINIGYAGDTDALMSDAEAPHTLGTVKATRYPLEDILTSATTINATVGGSGATGEWDVWLVYHGFV